jgi:3-dehydroquinate dehydratase II
MPKPVFVLNGPNLNLLGEREPEIYGRETLRDIAARLEAAAAAAGLPVEFRQSNREGELVDWIQEARTNACGIIINPAGYGHTSVAILDALLAAANIPCIEVHLSNIHRREPFRRRSLVSQAAMGVICGLGPAGYDLALEAMMRRLRADGVLLGESEANRNR